MFYPVQINIFSPAICGDFNFCLWLLKINCRANRVYNRGIASYFSTMSLRSIYLLKIILFGTCWRKCFKVSAKTRQTWDIEYFAIFFDYVYNLSVQPKSFPLSNLRMHDGVYAYALYCFAQRELFLGIMVYYVTYVFN